MGGCCSKPVAPIHFTDERYPTNKQTGEFFLKEGREYYQVGQYTQALVDLKEAVKFDHDSDISHLYIGILSGTQEEKIQAFQEALRINPHNLYAKYLLAEIENTKFNISYKRLPDNISSDFRDIINEVAHATPRTAEDHLARAKAYEMLQNRGMQARALEEFLYLWGDVKVCAELGELYFSLDQYDDAKRINIYGLTLKPDYVDFWINLANIYKKLREFDEEIKSALEVVKINKNATTNLILANAYKHKADNTGDKSLYDDAISYYTFSMLHDKDNDNNNPLLFYRLGYAVYKQNPHENEGDAIIYFQKAFDSYKDITTSYSLAEENPLKEEDPLYISKIFSPEREKLLGQLSNFITLQEKGRNLDNIGVGLKKMKEYHDKFDTFIRGIEEEKSIIFEAFNPDSSREELNITQAIFSLENDENEMNELINSIIAHTCEHLINPSSESDQDVSVKTIGKDGVEIESDV